MAAAVGAGTAKAAAHSGEPVDRRAFFVALGDTLIPSSETSPGFRSLLPRGIAEEWMASLASVTDADIGIFNRSVEAAHGKKFPDMTASEREGWLREVSSGNAATVDEAAVSRLQSILRLTRSSLMTLFYGNFPEHRVEKDDDGKFVPPPGDEHLIFNPNTEALPTAWDTTGFGGPLSWEQEQERRRRFEALWEAYEREMHG